MLGPKGQSAGGGGRSKRSVPPTLSKRLHRALAAGATALLLAGCQVPANHLNYQSAAAPSAQSADPFMMSNSAAPKPKSTPLAATPAVASGDSVIAPTALRLTGDPKELIGLDHATVRRALGDPTRIRTELPAQVWQYVTGDCVVDLYLYQQSGAMKVTYIEARSHTAEAAPTGRCLKSLLERPTASAE